MSKRKAETSDVSENRKVSKKNAAKTEAQTVVPKDVAAGPSNKVPKTLKDKVLAIVSIEEKFVSLQNLKKILAERYDIESTTTNNNKLNKLLKTLCDEDRNDFGKVGGSYHGGANSPSFLEYNQKLQAAEAHAAELRAHEGEIKCPYCLVYVDALKAWIGEDSVCRGGVYQCSSCPKKFYSWISDYGELMGHKQEYKFSGQYSR